MSNIRNTLYEIESLLSLVFSSDPTIRRDQLQSAVENTIPLEILDLTRNQKDFVHRVVQQLLYSYNIKGESRLLDLLRYARKQKQIRSREKESLNRLVDEIQTITKLPGETEITRHCRAVAKIVERDPRWEPFFIAEDAHFLPMEVSPYDSKISQSPSVNLLEFLYQSSRVLVLGEPGQGKTIAMERLFLDLANSRPPRIPILIRCVESINEPIRRQIWRSLRSTGELTLSSPGMMDIFIRQQKDQCYFLLDGLNEVPPDKKVQICSEIGQLAVAYPDSPIVTTSRVQDENWLRLRLGSAVQQTMLIQPIRAEQALKYLSKHLSSDADADLLWNQLDDKMKALIGTPLLLWMLKETWVRLRQQNNSPKIPVNRGALYESFVQGLLNREKGRSDASKVSESALQVALQNLAYKMSEQKALTIDEAEAEAVVGSEILKASKISGLLQGSTTLHFGPHHTIQEYFTARALRVDLYTKTKKSDSEIDSTKKQKLASYAAEPWWTETLIQLTGLVNDATQTALIIADANPFLAWWCLEEGGSVDVGTRELIRQKSIALVNSPQVKDRQSAARALGAMQNPRVIEPLTLLSFDTDVSVSRNALEGVLKLNSAGRTYFCQEFPKLVKKLTPKVRARWAENIANLDPRPGIGTLNKLPNMVWCEVPSDNENNIDGDHRRKTHKHVGSYQFFISKYQVTFQQFEAFENASDGYMEDEWWTGLVKPHRQLNIQRYKFPNHPREMVTWYDAIAFCKWLNHQWKVGKLTLPAFVPENYELRLPTETEWKKSAGGLDDQHHPHGISYDPQKSNIYGTGVGMTTAVGIFPDGASPYGVEDMSGNVWEWTLTEYESGLNDVHSSKPRVLLGGSWLSQEAASITRRRGEIPEYFDYIIGFRIVCSIAASKL